MPTPYKPRLECDRDLANFPPEFTDEPVLLTPDDEYVQIYFKSNHINSIVAVGSAIFLYLRPCLSFWVISSHRLLILESNLD